MSSKNIKPISIQEYKSTKEFIESIKSGTLYKELYPKQKNILKLLPLNDGIADITKEQNLKTISEPHH